MRQEEDADGTEQEHALLCPAFVGKGQEVPGLQMGEHAETFRWDAYGRQDMVRAAAFREQQAQDDGVFRSLNAELQRGNLTRFC